MGIVGTKEADGPTMDHCSCSLTNENRVLGHVALSTYGHTHMYICIYQHKLLSVSNFYITHRMLGLSGRAVVRDTGTGSQKRR